MTAQVCPNGGNAKHHKQRPMQRDTINATAFSTMLAIFSAIFNRVVRKMEQRGLFLLMVWRQQQARRCVTFWPSNVFDCDQGDLAFQVGRAALDALDAVESLGN